MKLFLAIVVCLAALAYGRPAEGPNNPLMGRVVRLCLRLVEDAVDDPSKRTWDDVFGTLAPLCEELLKMGKPGAGEGSGKRPPPDGDEGSGKRFVPAGGDGRGSGKRPPPAGGDGSGSGKRPPPRDGKKPGRKEGSGSGDGGSGDGAEIFMGLYRVCVSLHELFEAASAQQNKRSWEDIFMSLFTICEDAKKQMEADQAENEQERRAGGGGMKRPGMGPKGGRGGDESGSESEDEGTESQPGGGKGRPAGGEGRPAGGQGRPGDNGSGDGNGDGNEDELYAKGYKVVMHLIRLCEGLAKLGEEHADEKRDWTDIFMAVGEVCYATEAQIKAEMNLDESVEQKRAYGMAKSADAERGSGDKPKAGDESESEDADPAEVLLGICEDLLEMEKEALKRRGNKRSMKALGEAMKDVCDMAFAQAEADEADDE